MEEQKTNFLKEIEKENKEKAKPKLYKTSSFKEKNITISKIKAQENKDNSDSSDAENEEEKDEVESVDHVSDLPHSNFGIPPRKFSGKIKYTSNTQTKMKNKLKQSHDPKPWSDAYDERELISDKVPIYFSGTTGPVLFCIHGAGHSALSFGPLAVATKDFARVVSFDLRGHGSHYDEDETSMNIDKLLEESLTALKYTIDKYDDASVIICGHSLGGALAAKLSYKILHYEEAKDDAADSTGVSESFPLGFDLKHIVGVIVIDVAEGSALSALPFMEQIVENRPTSFENMHEAIKYGVTSGQVKRLESARLTIPDLVVEKDGQYEWRTDLLASKEYWREWFVGMNEKFLNIDLPKTLVIASNDRMDKELTIAQMQGKFKLVSMFDVGHTIQEDAPEELAKKIKEFITTFKIRTKYNEKLVITNAAGKQIVIAH